MARTTATISFQALELKGSLLPGPPCWKRFPSSTAPRSCCWYLFKAWPPPCRPWPMWWWRSGWVSRSAA